MKESGQGWIQTQIYLIPEAVLLITIPYYLKVYLNEWMVN